MAELVVKKVLNNNVVIATHSSYGEVVLIGKGIGFGRKQNDTLSAADAEKIFVLRDEKEQRSYLKLLPFIEEELHQLIITAIELIKEKSGAELNEHIHVALTDHLMFTVTRLTQGMEIRNPFLVETKTLYPREYELAKEVQKLFKTRLNLELPEGEAGFITLHIHSAITNKGISEVNQHSRLITELVNLIEEQMEVEIDKESVDYLRLVRHLRFAIERVNNQEKMEEPKKIALLLKNEYPVCYNLSWKLIKVMQQSLKKPVYDAEAVYLSMHLLRLGTKN